MWCSLPEGVRQEVLLKEASRVGVAYVPGTAFSCTGDADNHVRLTFARLAEEEIVQGTQRFAEALRASMNLEHPPKPISIQRPLV